VTGVGKAALNAPSPGVDPTKGEKFPKPRINGSAHIAPAEAGGGPWGAGSERRCRRFEDVGRRRNPVVEAAADDFETKCDGGLRYGWRRSAI